MVEDVFDGPAGRNRLRRGLRVDHLGDERLVLDPAGGIVHTVRGPAVGIIDRLLSGRGVDDGADPECLGVLIRAGIVTGSAVSRRDLGLLSAAASALVVTTLLPSATAAASGVDFSVAGSGGELRQFTVTDGSVTYDLYRLAHTSLSGTAVERTFSIGTTAREVQILLVGAGGAGGRGGALDGFDYPTSFGGGGGGGEVVEVDLGLVPSSTSLVVEVAGATTLDQRVGQSSFVRIGISDIVTAKGGGGGASEDLGATPGGSGGGGSTRFAAGGSASAGGSSSASGVTPSIISSGTSVGQSGGSSSGGGGGGAASQGSAGSAEQGGSGGPGTDISAFLKTYTSIAGDDPGDYPSVLGGGGGGAGSGVGTGGSGGTGGGGAGGVAVDNDPGDDTSVPAGAGTIATGGGGGGGASVPRAVSNPGTGASGVAWVRVRR